MAVDIGEAPAMVLHTVLEAGVPNVGVLCSMQPAHGHERVTVPFAKHGKMAMKQGDGGTGPPVGQIHNGSARPAAGADGSHAPLVNRKISYDPLATLNR